MHLKTIKLENYCFNYTNHSYCDKPVTKNGAFI